MNNRRNSCIAFDIGGTWFRSAIVDEDDCVKYMNTTPAINFLTHPSASIPELHNRLVDFIVAETHRLDETHLDVEAKIVGISMGACLNAHSGMILNSGPLWGLHDQPFDLLLALRERISPISWTIINDISAVALWYVAHGRDPILHRSMIFTVSTGIGCRTYDGRTSIIPTDPIYGIQGEVGHLPIDFRFRDKNVTLDCDCGGKNHLNAFCSGRGIASLVTTLVQCYPSDFAASSLKAIAAETTSEQRFAIFAEAVSRKDELALEVLSAVTSPVARTLLQIFTIDAEVERVILVGGVVNTLGNTYLTQIHRHLAELGFYQVSQLEPEWYVRRVRLGSLGETAGLVGAALAARHSATEG